MKVTRFHTAARVARYEASQAEQKGATPWEKVARVGAQRRPGDTPQRIQGASVWRDRRWTQRCTPRTRRLDAADAEPARFVAPYARSHRGLALVNCGTKTQAFAALRPGLPSLGPLVLFSLVLFPLDLFPLHRFPLVLFPLEVVS